MKLTEIESHKKKHWYWAWSQLNKAYFKTFHSTFYILLYFLRESLASDDCAARPSLIALQEMMFSEEDNQKVPPPPCGESIQCFFYIHFLFHCYTLKELSLSVYIWGYYS